MKLKIITIVLFIFSQCAIAQLAEAEYFWDADPGTGNGTSLQAQDGAINSIIEELFTTGVIIPPIGIHTFNIRLKDQQGNWGVLFKRIFRTDAIETSTTVSIAQAEYFWDTDPGEGNGIVLLALDNNLNEVIEDVFANEITVSQAGIHTFNIRVKDNQNAWSPVFKYVFSNDAILTPAPTTISEAEYFWNTDPGEGNGGSILAFDGNFNEAIENLFKDNVPLVQEGLNVFHIRIKDSNGIWGPTFKWVVSVESTLSVEDNLFEKTTTLYPVPAKDHITLAINNHFIGKGKIMIYDMTGKKILEYPIQKQHNRYTKSMNISSLTQGSYLVKINIGDKFIIKRLLK